MNPIIEEILYKNHTIEIQHDEAPENPRDLDNLGTFVTYSTKYNFGDNVNNGNIFDSRHELKECIENLNDDLVCLPVFVYNHSAIALFITQPHNRWDTSHIGYIYATQEKIKEWDTNSAMAKEILKAEIEIYGQYLNGEIYRFNIIGPYCDKSLWGIYQQNVAIKHAKEEIDNTLKWLSTSKKAKMLLQALYKSSTKLIKEHWC